MSRVGPIAAAVTAVALIALLIYGMVGKGGGNSLDEALARGETPRAPDAVLPPLREGGPRSLAEFAGKPVIVNFWASWCEPCKDEAPVVERAHQRLKKLGGTVLGVTVDDATPSSLAFAKRYGMTFPSVRDVDDKLGDAYRTTGVPETFVVDRQGRLVALSRGQIDDAFVTQAIARATQ